ncbi:hypothetical protein CWI37_1729p0010 [Hamiltosporidium tvaerminnensis]|uniref:Uncharacterized protein n=1 Tax=Hamiltosporidium tvaerminnensis TaxID=1176355 RepID=A0A4Q9KV86_9MICR|nr:hypothetical protein CWI37_1729p0010 [Hamiltosporidium tvaerminnensis]
MHKFNYPASFYDECIELKKKLSQKYFKNLNMQENDNNWAVEIINDFCEIGLTDDQLVQNVSVDITINYKTHQRLSEPTIFAVANNDMSAMNFKIPNGILGEDNHTSSSILLKQDDIVNYATKSLKLPDYL